MIIGDTSYIKHYGTPRHSGRYPWGSGGNAPASTRNRDFLDAIQKLKAQGLSDTEIARGFNMTTTQLRNQRTISIAQQRQDRINQINRLKDKGYSNVAIGERMGLNESTVRSLQAQANSDKVNVLQSTSDMLKRQVDQKGYVDIGKGVERSLPLSDNPAATIGISSTKFKAAVANLEQEGYKVHYMKVQQLGTGQDTRLKVLGPPNSPFPKLDQVKSITEFSEDGGRSFDKIHPPVSVNSRRVSVRYAEDGGAQADGVIYLRPGAKDLSLGSSRYAQVRIAVDGTHYLKGMAVLKDDLPPGVDIEFNTSKSSTGRKKDALKEMDKDLSGNIDTLNPFGAQIKRQSGALNIVNEEGDWDSWSRTLSSQVLSKQDPAFAKNQLNMTYERRQMELKDISSLTNPAVRKKLLDSFADETDSAAVHLKAAALPRQATKVILPLNSMKETEIYAPTFKNGEKVALVRFPHGGTFEIPVLTVNNRNPEARKVLGKNPTAPDAVGIHHKVAERLSGADFDGDHVLVIPNNRGTIKSTPPLEGLKDFDPQTAFPAHPGMIPISPANKQKEMGKITNLIADMTIRGANTEELASAIRHSMVVIDSEKHNLDYKSSARANGIAQLKEKYQKVEGKKGTGASTLITLATQETRVPERIPRRASKGGPVDPVTGKKVYEETGRTYVDKKGKVVDKTTKTTRLAETEDANTLSSGQRIEVVYAEHSNKLKALANEARKESVVTKPIPYSPSAKTAYSNEVASLNSKLNLALKNAPLERQAQVLANTVVSQKRQANPDMDSDDLKKIKNQALAESRTRTGAGKQRIVITQSEWDAIQAGAISNSKLTEILDNSDLPTVRKLATPHVDLKMTPTKTSRARIMSQQGYTQAEIADALGVSLSTLKASINE